MKKLLYISPNSKSAVSWYRGLGVLNHLRGVDITNGSSSDQSWTTISKHDIVFLERPCREVDVYVMNYAKMLNKTVWVDFDDLAWEVPDFHPNAKFYQDQNTKNNMIMCLQGADVVTTTNSFLADKIKKFNPNVIVIPNALNDYVFKDFKKYNPKSKDILYRGGEQHMADLDEFGDQIVNVMDDNKGHTFHFWGFNPFMISRYTDGKNLKWQNSVDIMYYFTLIQGLNPRAVMVPLINCEFNKAVSNIAWIEATLSGAITLGMNYIPSFNSEQILSGNDEYFEAGLIDILKDDDSKFHEASVEKIKSDYLLSVVNEKRYEIVNP